MKLQQTNLGEREHMEDMGVDGSIHAIKSNLVETGWEKCKLDQGTEQDRERINTSDEE